jgi:hypothetical protein
VQPVGGGLADTPLAPSDIDIIFGQNPDTSFDGSSTSTSTTKPAPKPGAEPTGLTPIPSTQDQSQLLTGATNPLDSILSVLGLQGLQEGGFLDPNISSIVGEQGPELIPPGNNQVIPLESTPFQQPSAATNTVPDFGTAGTALTDQLLPDIASSFQTALGAPRFDLTETFQTAEDVFQGDLDRQLAQVREEFSGLGLGPGSTDRNERLLRTGGDLASRFRLGQLGLSNQAFENAEQRRLAGLGQAGGVTSATDLPFERQLRALPFQMASDQQAFENFSNISGDAQQLRNSLLPIMGNLLGLPGDQASQLFSLENQARGIADTDIQRRLQELSRTQGGLLDQIIALLGGTPPQETEFGPSPLSQFGDLGSAIASFFLGL